MKITREQDELVVRINLKARRWNPYNDMAGEDPDTGEMDAIVGVIHNDKGCIETGFMGLQDMSYKSKDDQLTSWVVHFDGDTEQFEQLCKDLLIPLWYI